MSVGWLASSAWTSSCKASPRWPTSVPIGTSSSLAPGPLAASLEASVPAALRGRVKWLGFLDTQRVQALLSIVDCLAITSTAEAWGVVVEEAVAAGLVVVASDAVGAAKEIVRDRETGRIFATGSVESLASALADVSDPSQHERYRAAVPKATPRVEEQGRPAPRPQRRPPLGRPPRTLSAARRGLLPEPLTQGSHRQDEPVPAEKKVPGTINSCVQAAGLRDSIELGASLVGAAVTEN